MISLITPFSFFLLGFLFILSLFFLQYILFPYRKDHIVTSFTPILGPFWPAIKNFKKRNDFFAHVRDFSRDFPNRKVLVTNLGSNIYFMLRDTQYIKEFLQKPLLYHKHKMMDFFKPIMGNGLVSSEDEVWKVHRKIISASFHYEFIKSNVRVIQETTKKFLDKVAEEDYKDFPSSKIQEITGEIVGRLFFGQSLNSYKIDGKLLTLELGEIFPGLGECGKSLSGLIFGSKILKLKFIPRYGRIVQRIKNFKRVCYKIIQDRKFNPVQANDFLGLLLATQEAEDPQQRFSDEDIVDEFITFFVAGMDTTAILCTMTLYCLTKYPEYYEELKEERMKTYNKEKVVTAETLQRMDMLHSVFKETLRFYPPIPGSVLRVAAEDHQLLDLSVKKGDVIKSEYIAVYFDEKHFDNPYKFDANRWNTHSQKIDPFAFLPFSAGPRNCIGQHLAILEAKIIISEMLERFTFKLKEGYQLRMIAKALYEPADEMVFELTPIER